jgi:uracil-DNA glycosylase
LIDLDTIKIHDSWKTILIDEFAKPYFAQIKNFLLQEKQTGHTIYPK